MYVEYADATGFMPPVDVYQQQKKSAPEIRNPVLKEAGIPLDFPTWLPYAAEKYHISKDPRNYLLVPTISVPSGLPNRNGVAFPREDLLDFSVDHGCQAYRTWIGKPMHLEHQNADPTTAIGVIVDVAFRPLLGYGNGKTWKLVKLLAVDRDKDAETAGEIARRERNAYSMGAMVERYSCGRCGAPLGQCRHIGKGKAFYIDQGHLVHKVCHGITGFETSSVATPAWVPACSDTLFSMG